VARKAGKHAVEGDSASPGTGALPLRGLRRDDEYLQSPPPLPVHRAEVSTFDARELDTRHGSDPDILMPVDVPAPASG
jgi:hypothetical protein